MVKAAQGLSAGQRLYWVNGWGAVCVSVWGGGRRTSRPFIKVWEPLIRFLDFPDRLNVAFSPSRFPNGPKNSLSGGGGGVRGGPAPPPAVGGGGGRRAPKPFRSRHAAQSDLTSLRRARGGVAEKLRPSSSCRGSWRHQRPQAFLGRRPEVFCAPSPAGQQHWVARRLCPAPGRGRASRGLGSIPGPRGGADSWKHVGRRRWSEPGG